MIVAIASGKGGTGKTTVATALAVAVATGLRSREGADSSHVQLLDCDVEEPNAHLFLRPTIDLRREVGIPTPVVDPQKCTGCRRCAEVCAYHAIAVLGKEVLVFNELCHGCGSCTLNCPEKAIHEEIRVTGVVEEGRAGDILFAHGILNVGEAMAGPVIRQVKKLAIDDHSSHQPQDGPDDPGRGEIPRKRGGGARSPSPRDSRLVVLDAPPGTSCPVVASLVGADYALMVTEPTPFGLHDLRMAVDMARGELGLPVGVVVNRDGVGDEGVDEYCRSQGIPILMRIPLDRRIAEACSEGIPLPTALPEYQDRFLELHRRLREEVYR